MGESMGESLGLSGGADRVGLRLSPGTIPVLLALDINEGAVYPRHREDGPADC